MFLGASNVTANWSFQYAGTTSLNPCFPDSNWCSSAWNPILTFDTTSGADGFYSGSFSGDFPYCPDNTIVRVAIDNTFLLGGGFSTGPYITFSDGSFNATIAEGRVVDFGGFFAAQTGFGNESWYIVFGSMSYSNCCIFGSALQAFAIAIPEPTTYALLASGLGLLYGMRIRPQPRAHRKPNSLRRA